MAFHRNALQIYQFEIGNLQSAIRNHESSPSKQFSSSECGADGGLNRNFEEGSELIWKFVRDQARQHISRQRLRNDGQLTR
jgi:hypothetical protein